MHLIWSDRRPRQRACLSTVRSSRGLRHRKLRSPVSGPWRPSKAGRDPAGRRKPLARAGLGRPCPRPTRCGPAPSAGRPRGRQRRRPAARPEHHLYLADVAAEGGALFLRLIAGALQSFSRKSAAARRSTRPISTRRSKAPSSRSRAEREQRSSPSSKAWCGLQRSGGAPVAGRGSAVAAAGQAPQAFRGAPPRRRAMGALLSADLRRARRPATCRPAAALAEASAAGVTSPAPWRRSTRCRQASATPNPGLPGRALAVGRAGRRGARPRSTGRSAAIPTSGLAYALRAIIDVVQQRARGGARQRSARRSSSAPRRPRAKIALSYAQQAKFDLEAARDTLLAGGRAAARRRARLGAAGRAVADAGRSRAGARGGRAGRGAGARSRAHADRARLCRSRRVPHRRAPGRRSSGRSRSTPADPLPRLGLGLAQIRDGDLEAGRANLEIAVGLDRQRCAAAHLSGQGLFRGEAGRDLPASSSRIAKELDPLDPTAYLYDAIRKQTENRPVEALRELEKSIELNDNRAVYRSRLLLDPTAPRAAPASRRIYDDLGFESSA